MLLNPTSVDHLSWRVAAARTLVLLVLAGVVLSPALETGYWAEDLYQSIYPRATLVEGRSVVGVITSSVELTLRMGRFFPMTGVLIPGSHLAFPAVGHYKGYLLAGTLLDLLLFAALMRSLTGRGDYAILAACTALGLIQYRLTIDPSFGFFGQMQLLLAGLFLSLLTLQGALKARARSPRRSAARLTFSILLFLGCALTYEVVYVLVLLPLFLIARASTSRMEALRYSAPFLLVVAYCASQTLLFRWLFPIDIYWHKTDLDPGAVARTIVYQCSAGLPLSYLLADPLDLFPPWRGGEMLGWLMRWRVAAVILVAFALCVSCLRPRAEATDRARLGGGWGWLLGFGLVLAIGPSLLLAISPYHRAAISPGVGWIPVLMQIYGVALLISRGLWLGVTAAVGGGPDARWKRLVASAIVAVIVGATYRANGEVARCFVATPGTERFRADFQNAGGGYHGNRLLLEAALQAGLMDEVPDHSKVGLHQEYPFWYDATYGPAFYAAYAGRPFNVVPPSTHPTETSSGSYLVRDLHVARGFGSVMLCLASPEDEQSFRGLRLFLKMPRLAGGVEGLRYRVTAEDGDGVSIVIDGDRLPVIRSGLDWVLLSMDPMKSPFLAETARVEFEKPPMLAEATSEGSTNVHARRHR